MKKNIIAFFKRGLIFGGFGPIIVSIIYYIVSLFETVNLNPGQLLVAVVSSYLLAFVQSGATVFITTFILPPRLVSNLAIFFTLIRQP